MFPKCCSMLTAVCVISVPCIIQTPVQGADAEEQEQVISVLIDTAHLPVWTMDDEGTQYFDPSVLISSIKREVAPKSWLREGVDIHGRPEGRTLEVSQTKDVLNQLRPYLYRLSSFSAHDPAKRLAENCKRGEESTCRVLLFIADPDSRATDELFDAQYGDATVPSLKRAFSNFIVQCASPSQGRQLEFWNQASIDKNTALVAIVSAEGAKLVEAPFEQFCKEGELDDEAFAAFLDEHSDPFPNAEAELQTALAKAAEADKLVLIQMSGPGCGPCLMLSKLLSDQSSVVAKDYVHLKLDTRMESADLIKEELVRDLNFIPWMAIVSSDRKVLATSVGPDGNIGYPSNETSKAHLREMLESTSKRLTPDDIDALLKAIEEK